MKKVTALILALVLAISLTLPAMATETEEFVYVAFGDSIAAGYGLSDYDLQTDSSEYSYVHRLAGSSTLCDFAASGMKSSELLELLGDEEVLASLAKADLVTISIGGNDLILPLLQALLPGFDIDSLQLGSVLAMGQQVDIEALMEATGLNDISKLIPAIMTVAGDLPNIVADYKKNLANIVEIIKTAAPNGKIVLQTVYNPYRGCPMVADYETYLDAIMSTLNTAVKSVAEEKGCVLADVYTAFVPYGSGLLNSAEAETFYDPHPNYNGHVVIAKTIIAACEAAGAALPDGRDILPDSLFSDVTLESPYLEAVTSVSEMKLMNGIGDGKFNPDGGLTRGTVVTILSRISPENEASPAAGFTDVPAGAWYEAAVNWAAANGIVNGYEDGTFAPNEYMTREQLAAVLYRYFGSPEVSGTLETADAAEAGSWAQSALVWALANGILSPDGNGAVCPKVMACRGDAAVGVYAALVALK